VKLVITIEATEKDIAAAIAGVPEHWFMENVHDGLGTSPIRMLARAMKAAYENELAARGQGEPGRAQKTLSAPRG